VLGLSSAGTRDCHLDSPWVTPRATRKLCCKILISPFLTCGFVGCMFIGEREEHEAANEAVAADPNVMAVLTQCGLVKFFLCPFMRAQPRLLNALVDYWHPDAEAFYDRGAILGAHHRGHLFLTGLSRRGEPVNLQTFPMGPSKVSELIAEYCVAGTNQGTSSDTGW
jgi:hypothetical protein